MLAGKFWLSTYFQQLFKMSTYEKLFSKCQGMREATSIDRQRSSITPILATSELLPDSATSTTPRASLATEEDSATTHFECVCRPTTLRCSSESDSEPTSSSFLPLKVTEVQKFRPTWIAEELIAKFCRVNSSNFLCETIQYNLSVQSATL